MYVKEPRTLIVEGVWVYYTPVFLVHITSALVYKFPQASQLQLPCAYEESLVSLPELYNKQEWVCTMFIIALDKTSANINNFYIGLAIQVKICCYKPLPHTMSSQKPIISFKTFASRMSHIFCISNISPTRKRGGGYLHAYTCENLAFFCSVRKEKVEKV